MQISKLRQRPDASTGQIIVLLALIFIILISIVGLAVDLGYVFVSYSRLRRAVDSAALAATSQFREGYTQENLEKAAQEFLDLNSISDTTLVQIEACAFAVVPGDPQLCTAPARKLIRVTVTQNVPLFFLAVIGFHEVPISVDAISEAASVDLVLLIDRSESMTWDAPSGSAMRNPKDCNPNDCHPFQEVKNAALTLIDRLYLSKGSSLGYDRVSIVTFDRFPHVDLEMTDNYLTIKNTIENLDVYEGEGKCPWANEGSAATWIPQSDLFEGPCRLHSGLSDGSGNLILDSNGNPIPDGNFVQMWSRDMDLSQDPRGWMVTNSGGGLKVSGNVLGGQYPAGYPRIPVNRQEALWVVVWLTDGYTNAGYTDDGAEYIQTRANAGTVICPVVDWNPEKWCVDQDARPTVDNLTADPPLLFSSSRHLSTDDTNYDPDDYARDMVDFVGDPINGQGALIFTIGLGPNITRRTASEELNGFPPPGQTLLEYGAHVGSGIYYPAPTSDQLNDIFLAIANKIATRLTQ